MDWDACLASAPPAPLAGILLRMVESQEQVATNQLVSGLERQAVLEDLLEANKPPNRAGAARLHYLLATPFRYPPLKWGSRFGRRNEPSLFYGSLQISTLLCEAAYYRFVFWSGMSIPPRRKLDTQHMMLSASYQTDFGMRLQDPPFDQYRELLAHPADYAASQALGSRMRTAGIQAFEFVSARNPAEGINVALFTPAAFSSPAPLALDAWLCETTAEQVSFRAVHRRDVGEVRVTHDFPLSRFLVAGRLPLPA